jgi:hypothetical protein
MVLFLAVTALAFGPAAAAAAAAESTAHSAAHRRALHATEGVEGGGAPAPAGARPASRVRPSIVIIGDGLTESSFSSQSPGFGALIEDKYKRKVRLAVCAFARHVRGGRRSGCEALPEPTI